MWQKCLLRIVAILVSLYFPSTDTQILTFDVRVGNLLHMQQGIGWPLHLNVAAGQEALIRLSEHLENQQTCEVTTPTGSKFDVQSPPDIRYEAWSDGCGVRIRNVNRFDEGRWRMVATRGNHSIVGWSEIHVSELISSYTPDAITLVDGQTHALVNLSSLNNSYCLVAQPFRESSLIPGQCLVTLDRTTRAVQGRWGVLLGIPGQVNEVHVDANVAVEAERLDVGYVREADSHKLHLYCNILHTTKNITFCRFQKTTAASGFNVMDGLSDGRHSYYGLGFSNRQCGMTIESVTDQDFGTWRCTIGVMERVGNVIHQLPPMQALVTIPVDGTRIRRNIERSEQEIPILFVQQDSNLTVTCRADASLVYCWFQHPNGTQLTPVERQPVGEQAFWYSGENLQSGDCGITFANVTEEEAGIWTCHMGYQFEVGVEVMNQIEVRVTGALAANDNEVETVVGESATLYCRTSNGPRPLDYCRFFAPTRIGMSIDPLVTDHNAILNRYYFTPGRDLAYGDCSLTITPVHPEDLGEWTCAALLGDHVLESKDTVLLYQSSTQTPRLMAGLVGASIGIVFLALVFAVTMWYKKGRPLPIVPFSSTSQRFSRRSDNNSFHMDARSSGNSSSLSLNAGRSSADNNNPFIINVRSDSGDDKNAFPMKVLSDSGDDKNSLPMNVQSVSGDDKNSFPMNVQSDSGDDNNFLGMNAKSEGEERRGSNSTTSSSNTSIKLFDARNDLP